MRAARKSAGREPLEIDIARFPVPTAAEERALLARAKAGDAPAREELVLRNLRLVAAVASEFRRPRGFSPGDLLGHGVDGLMVAIDRFDPARLGRDGRPARLSAYASFWIKHKIRRAIADCGSTIRIPVWARQEASRARREGRTPPGNAEAWAMSDFAAAHEGTEVTLLRVDHRYPSPAEAAIRAESREVVDRLLRHLDARHARVLRMRYGIGGDAPMSPAEVGRALGVTRERARQIEGEALGVLRLAAAAPGDPGDPGPAPEARPAAHRPGLGGDDLGRLRAIAARHLGESPSRIADRFAAERGWRPEPVEVARAIR
jgi:RNA polymerase primary sigma factor